MNPAEIKQTPEYKLSKIDIIKKLYLDKNEANNVIQNLSENLANSKNKIEELLKPKNCIPSGALPVELEPSVENDNDNEILQLKSEIEGLHKITNELEQDKEEYYVKWEGMKYCADSALEELTEARNERNEKNQEVKELKLELETLKKTLSHCGEGDLIEQNEKIKLKLDKKDEYIEKYKNENDKLKEKLCHIEATMKAFSVLVNCSVN